MEAETSPFATVLVSRPSSAESVGHPWLVQLHPLDLERGKIELDHELAVIGRADTCRIQLQDESVSREHASIEWTPAGHKITDLGSTNGVLVNDRQVESATLEAGDRIQLGQRIFRFLVDNDQESEYYETVYGMMTRDGLTGAFNKRYLLEYLEREVIRCRKYQRSLAVIMMDIDHFKSINDTYGHLTGDDVLRELSERIQGLTVDGAVFARFGGEEFAVVAVESDIEAAKVLAESCREIVQNTPFETSSGPLEITISVGVTSPNPTSLSDHESILEVADQRLYEAKRAGRNRVIAE